ncbi:histidine kinase [Gluconobacter japonicus]|uniref:GAF domain-containing protein n=1 Tax=Gluconobacter japonicus TaxID=376620 RepID=A0A9Q2IUR4_GLUJA|nr:GAF domain-containing protein [Gluconobacter japonicus]KXV40917.1 histidine kinase [Gluconobacter japonicus]MBF0870212.1 GAF domain-containing protein [Gluconobacter japonicus]
MTDQRNGSMVQSPFSGEISVSAPIHRLTTEDLLPTVESVVSSEPDMIANMANIAALLFEALPDINWSGFYLWKEDQLVLGPFQGRLACTRIPLGKGVCGTVAAQKTTLVVPDVHAFPGHIACDAASESEIVIPVLKDGALIGVLDIDSPIKNRFHDADRMLLEKIVSALEKTLTV